MVLVCCDKAFVQLLTKASKLVENISFWWSLAPIRTYKKLHGENEFLICFWEMEKVRKYRSLYDPVSVLKGLMVFVHVWVYTHVITASRSGGFAMIKVGFIGRLPWSICVRVVRSGRKARWMSLGLWWACSSYIAKMYMLYLVWFNLFVSFNHILPNSFIFCTSLIVDVLQLFYMPRM